MKFRLLNCLWLKPFDESSDGVAAGKLYAASGILTFAIAASALLSLSALLLVLAKHPAAPFVLAAAIGLTAILAGLEWNAGLKARSLNLLFSVLIVTLGYWLVSSSR